jgi:hypothetical protein
MQQVKLFHSTEGKLRDLESEINEWLAKSGVRVIQMFGNLSPQGSETELRAINAAQSAYVHSDVFLAVLYETR